MSRWPIGRLVSVGVVVAALYAPLNSVSAAPWPRPYVNSLPDSAFAAIEVAPDGKKIRHLPHHTRDGRVDLPHVRNALSRLSQVKWVDPQHATAARQHLEQHLQQAHDRGSGPH